MGTVNPNLLVNLAAKAALKGKTAEPLYPPKEGILKKPEDAGHAGALKVSGGTSCGRKQLKSIGYERGTKKGKQYERLDFRQDGKLGHYEAEYHDGVIKVNFKDTSGPIGMDQEVLDRLIKDSPSIWKIEKKKSEVPGESRERSSLSFIIWLKEMMQDPKKYALDVYEVPDQGKLVLDLPV